MNRKSIRVIKWLGFLLIALLLIGIILYLFVYDKNRSRIYQPEIDEAFLQAEIAHLSSASSSWQSDEVLVEQNGWKGIVYISCDTRDVQDIKEDLESLMEYRYPYGEHFCFDSDSSEVVVWDAEYMPIVDAWKYGWLSSEGNLYKRWHSKEEADAMPNYRNHFRFNIRNGNDAFYLDIYCNKASAQRALSETIHYYNNLNQ